MKRKKAGKKRKKWPVIVGIAAAVLIAAGIGGFSLMHSRRIHAEDAPSRALSTNARRDTLTTSVVGSGSLAGGDPEEIQVPAGLLINSVLVEAGDTVSAGDALATVDETALKAEIAEVQGAISDIDTQLSEQADDTELQSVASKVEGRVKKIYAGAGDSVADVMVEHGALILLSLDGKMSVQISTESDISVGDSVSVALSSGTAASGTVEAQSGGIVTVTLTDDGPAYGDEVTVSDSSGQTLGTGTLSIHQELEITGTTGNVYAVLVAENEWVEKDAALITLADVQASAEYQELISSRTAYKNRLQKLMALAVDGTIVSPGNGVIESVELDEGSTTAVSSSGSSASGSSSGGSGTSIPASGMADYGHAASGSAVKLAVASQVFSGILCSQGESQKEKAQTQGELAEGNLQEGNQGEGQDAEKQVPSSDNPNEEVTVTSPPASTVMPVPSTSPQQDAPSTSAQQDAPSTSAQQDAPSTSSQQDAPSTSAQQDAPSTSSQQETPSTSAQQETQKTPASGEGQQSQGGNVDQSESAGGGQQESVVPENSIQDSGQGQSAQQGGDSNMAAQALESDSAAGSGIVSQTESGDNEDSDGSGNNGNSGNSTSVSSEVQEIQEEVTGFTISSQDQMLISIDVDELDILSVQVGQEAQVTLDAIEGETFAGTVTEVSDSTSGSDGSAKYAVEITIAKNESMRVGMSASATIVTEKRENVIVLPADAVQERGRQVFVYTQYDQESNTLSGEAEVVTGMSDGEKVEIASGLNEGDTVYYQVMEAQDSGEDSQASQDGGMFNMDNAGGMQPGGDMPGGNMGGGRGGPGGQQ